MRRVDIPVIGRVFVNVLSSRFPGGRGRGAKVRRGGRPLRQGGLLKIEREGADVAFISALPAFLTHRAYTLASLRLRRMTGPQDLQEGDRVT